MQLTIHSPSILICTRSVDFRRGIDGLVNIVQSELNANPQENIFIFYNRSRDKAKILAGLQKLGYDIIELDVDGKPAEKKAF